MHDELVLLRTLILVLVSAAVAAGLGLGAQPATAAQAPCWKQLLNDWYDGRIDGTYEARCYREAIRNLPADVDAYSHAREDIERALLAAMRTNGGPFAPGEPVPPEPADDAPAENGRPAETEPDDEDEVDEDEVTAAPRGPRGDEGGLLGYVRPSNADAIPVPLLVLAGLAMLLLAAAAAGFVARHVQARRLRAVPQRSAPPKP